MSAKFSFIWRNPGHWDVCGESGRLMRIRGERGAVVLFDERRGTAGGGVPHWFRTVGAAMAWVADELSYEAPA